MEFFKKNNKRNSIQIFDTSTSPNSINALRIRIKKLDQQMIEINKIILEAQMVRVRSIFSVQTNFIQGFQKKFVESSVLNSISWHQRQIVLIRDERNKLKLHLERITGQFWPNRLKRLFLLIASILLLFFFCVILLLGLFAAVYSLPIIFLLFLLLWTIRNIKN